MTSEHRAGATPSKLCLRHAQVDTLLAQVGVGDRQAFGALYDQLSGAVYAMGLAAGYEPRLAAEVTQDVFLRWWRQAGTFDPMSGSAWTWLQAIAVETVGSRSRTPSHA